jgi:dipeptidyl aminopeptidase/acylaminoacyl peptidase
MNRWMSFARRIALFPLCLVALMTDATPVDTPYQMPGDDVAAIVDARPTPAVSPAPRGDVLLVAEYPALATLSDLAEPEYRLAGVRINPANNGPSQPRYFNSLRLQPLDGGQDRPIVGFPERARLLAPTWSPDGRYVAVLHVDSDAVRLWRIDVDTAVAHRWSEVAVNAVWGGEIQWTSDGTAVYVLAVPDGRGAEPGRSATPDGPVVLESRGRTAPARTFQDLLQDVHDERLFDYFFTSRIVRVALDDTIEPIGRTGVISAFSVAPGGAHLLVTELRRPYSYAVPHQRFARRIEVWSDAGEPVYRVVDQALADDLPISFDAVVPGRRDPAWRADANATLIWAEAADGGNPAVEANVRDRLFQLAAPFEANPRVVLELGKRYIGAFATETGSLLVWERWWQTRDERVWHAPARGDVRTLWERSFEDRYGDPGMPMTVLGARGQRIVPVIDGRILLAGAGASPEGNRPFVDARDLDGADTQRLWRSEAPYFEQPLALLDRAAPVVLTQREAPDEPPGFVRRDLRTSNGRATPIFQTPHPTPDLVGVHRELITYQRDDGLGMSALLYLPAGYEPARDGPLPTVIWAYPREFRTAAAAEQIGDSPWRFNRLSYWTAQFLVTQGYAVLDNATMPVVGGDGVEPNDTFIEQLVMNARAAVQAGVERGVTDPERVALGGHSYGAFMTANILAHSDLFRAGIARSGAYNRTLTPFGFQREERTLWDDTDLYVAMSPFFHANTIHAPLLLIHGAEDNNPGTFPLQTERLYQAIKGLGGTARMVMLPLESHGYRARESILHMLWETTEWLDEFVKFAEPRAADE